MNCARCNVPMRKRSSSPQSGLRVQAGRGLCDRCWHWADYHNRLADYPSQVRSRDDLLDDYVMLRAEGYTWQQCAERLGMTRASFERAMFRARAAGDPRAGRPGERWPVAS